MKKKIGFIAVVGIIILAVYHLLIYYDNYFPLGRMWETPAVRPHEEPLLIMEAGVVPAHGGEEIYRVMPGETIVSPIKVGNQEDIEIGKIGYFSYCAQCHGEYHDGNGTVGQSFAPLPTDLQSVKVQSKPDGAIFKSISYSIPGTRQPSMATTIRIHERWQIVAYIKSLGVRKTASK
jgi:hypothetical protein